MLYQQGYTGSYGYKTALTQIKQSHLCIPLLIKLKADSPCDTNKVPFPALIRV